MATSKKTADVFPKTIGAAIDLLYTLRSTRLEAQRAVDAMENKESALRGHIMANFQKSDLNGGKGKLATASIMTSSQAEIVDFPQYVGWVVKNKDYSCLQKRVGITSVREHWDNGEQIPGIEMKTVETLSLTKANG